MVSLLNYVGFNAEDAQALVELRPHAAPHFTRVAEEFYERTREDEAAHAVFSSEGQIAGLQYEIAAWMDRLLSGVYDDRYCARTAEIGRVHVRLGLPQRYIVAGMTVLRLALARIARGSMGDKAGATEDALTRLLDVDLAVMLESYHEALIRRVEHLQTSVRPEATVSSGDPRYAEAMELAPVLLLALDREGRITMANREAEHTTGFARDELRGASFVDLLVAEDERDAPRVAIASAVAQPSLPPSEFDGSIRGRAGHLRSVSWRLTPVPQGSPTSDSALYLVGCDVTDRNAALELARRREKLAAMGTLAAGLAHEIRNPLNGAQLHIAFLERAIKRGTSETEMLDAVRVVGDEIKRLAQLATEFLDFARPSPLLVAHGSVRDLFARVAGRSSSRAKAAGIEIATDVPARDVAVEADLGKLEQLIAVLLENAVDALEGGGGGRITLRGRRVPRHTALEVEDNGSGIPEPSAPIFDAFYTTKPKGTGLGLAIAHRIVTDHGGSITVESGPGGTIFRVLLPHPPPGS